MRYEEIVKLDNDHEAYGLALGKGWKIIRTNASPESLPNILKGTFSSLEEAREALRRHQYQLGIKRLNTIKDPKTNLTPFIPTPN